jgi:TIR domain
MRDFDLFISYRRRDADRVLRLVAALRQRGLAVWLDQSEISEFAPNDQRDRSRSRSVHYWPGIPRSTEVASRARWS